MYPTDEKESAMKNQKSPPEGKRTLERLLFFVGAGLVVAIVVLLVYYPMMQRSLAEDRRFSTLEKRVAGIEEKIGGGGAESHASGSDEMARRLEQMASDMENLKTAREDDRRRLDERTTGIVSRLDMLSTELSRKKKENAGLSPASTQALKPLKTKVKTGGVKNAGKAPAPPKNTDGKGKHGVEKTGKPIYHQVKPGDTFYSICRTYGISLQKLKDMNHLDEKSRLHPGQKIVVGP